MAFARLRAGSCARVPDAREVPRGHSEVRQGPAGSGGLKRRLWDLWHLHRFDSKQCAVLLVGQQIQQSVWTLPHLTDSLFELS